MRKILSDHHRFLRNIAVPGKADDLTGAEIVVYHGGIAHFGDKLRAAAKCLRRKLCAVVQYLLRLFCRFGRERAQNPLGQRAFGDYIAPAAGVKLPYCKQHRLNWGKLP